MIIPFQRQLASAIRAAGSVRRRSPLPASERRSRRRHRALVMLSVGAMAVACYAADVDANVAVESRASARIVERAGAVGEAGADSALVFLTGVGTNNADVFADFQGPAFQRVNDGRLWSVDYANAALDPEAIGEAIEAQASRVGVHRVSVIGRSVGGIVATRVVEHLISNGRLAVDLLVLESTPDGVDGVRAESVGSMRLAEYLTLIPGAEHSTFVRVGLETFLRRGQYGADPVEFAATVDEVTTSVRDGRLPGSWLVVDQVLAIADARLERRLDAIGASEQDRRRPAVLYLGTAAPGFDDQVDEDGSGESVCRYARAAGMDCLNRGVPGAVHARPELAVEAYTRILTGIAPVYAERMAEESRRLAVQRFEIPTRVGMG